MYGLTKASAVKARAQAISRLKSVHVSADPALREELAGPGNAELFRACARFADVSGHEEVGDEAVLQATRITLGLPAHRIGRLSEQTRKVDARLARLPKCHAFAAPYAAREVFHLVRQLQSGPRPSGLCAHRTMGAVERKPEQLVCLPDALKGWQRSTAIRHDLS
ncbi:hypothetical protein AB0E10_43970 [Streptomyces sp. NPDC048045]|uniref:hypothetical protein n=1 Tax=Streptomyces sp. NPDC048045 TaxID=3154710 RepID=UPI003422DFB4